MPRIKLITTNRKAAIVVTLVITFFMLTTILFPLLLLYFIPQSAIGNYILNNLYFTYFMFPFIIYFFYTGIFFYKIKIDAYIIDVRSNRVIVDIFKAPSYIDISHEMLYDFSFFDRPFSFNKTLMIKIKTNNGKKVAKRFNLSFMSRAEEQRIRKVLVQIIANTKND